MNKRCRMNRCLTLFGRTMANRTSRRPFLLGFKWCRTAIVPMLATYLTAILLLVGTLHALDPNKHLTQYIHTAWRTQDGSLPSGMFSITQTSDGFLYLLSLSGDVYRFDGVRFVPSSVPLGVSGKVFADNAGGLWVVADELVHLKHGIVVSHFKLKGIHGFKASVRILTELCGSAYANRTLRYAASQTKGRLVLGRMMGSRLPASTPYWPMAGRACGWEGLPA